MYKKILIIEDEQGIRDNIRILLESEKFDVISASNGNEGITKTRNYKPDLIICDIMMPDINGYEVLNVLSREKDTSLIPFIFLTAKVEHSDLRKGMELGADDYIFKPFDTDELLHAIRARLNKYEAIRTKIEENASHHKKYTPIDKILFHVRDYSVMVTIEKIIYISAEQQYTHIYVECNKHFLIKRSLTTWEKILPQNLFIRIHRSTIVNLNYVNKIEHLENNQYKISLNNSEKILDVSRRFYKNLKNIN